MARIRTGTMMTIATVEVAAAGGIEIVGTMTMTTDGIDETGATEIVGMMTTTTMTMMIADVAGADAVVTDR
jgi:hypothetical protein